MIACSSNKNTISIVIIVGISVSRTHMQLRSLRIRPI